MIHSFMFLIPSHSLSPFEALGDSYIFRGLPEGGMPLGLGHFFRHGKGREYVSERTDRIPASKASHIPA